MNYKIISSMLFIFFIQIMSASAQQTKLNMTYDNSGNRVVRRIIVIPLLLHPNTGNGDKNDTTIVKNITSKAIDSTTQSNMINVLSQSINVFPNPTQYSIKIEIKDKSITEYTAILYDINGREITREECTELLHEIDLSKLNIAHYVLSIVSNGKMNTWKIIKN